MAKHSTIQTIKAPFPYFGGKSRIAHKVWERFGEVDNYVEPFAGSLAVLLARPHPPGIETVNDLDAFLSNFWRAVQHDPEGVAKYADYPVSELDLHARHQWLVNWQDFIELMRTDPDCYDVKVAGWWVWGICCWIGDGWCGNAYVQKLPHLGDAGRGVHRQLPHLGHAGMGVHRQLPHLRNAGMGVHRKLHHLGGAGMGVHEYLCALAERLRRVRVCCGEWNRVVTPVVTFRHGLTGVFLDPPYGHTSGRADGGYAAEERDVSQEVHAWCLENADNPLMRIALCGFEGEYKLPGWECLAWKRAGGYSSQGRAPNKKNAERERIWFSPHCLKSRQMEIAYIG